MFLQHELIKPSSIELRDYQSNIAHAALEEPTLVVLPTGMGKTVIALYVIAETLRRSDGKVLFMAPTKPLVEQHAKFLREHLLGFEPVVFTGEVPPSQRKELWESERLVVSTPQVVANDMDSGILSLKPFDLIVFDEAHRASGDYAYVSIGKKFSDTGGLALGMTASPGSDVSKIAEVCENLGITWVEIRSELDEDVVEYTQQVKTEFISVGMQEGMARIVAHLRQILDEQVAKLRAAGFVDPKKPVSTRDLLTAGATIRAQLNSGKKSYHLFKIASVQALAMKVNHGIELAETQGRGALENYFEKQVRQAEENKRSKAVRDLVKDSRFQEARNSLYKMANDHPKLTKMMPLLRQQFASKPESKVIVFTHYRDTCDLITKRLEEIEGVRPVRFVGQASKGEDIGLKQKEQREVIDKFRGEEYNVLVATSIAEEGLDIPATDLVIFYEPVPSEIRTIQRRGRTGRTQAGRVIVMITKDTKDEAYFWSSRKKEQQMRRELDNLRRKLRARKGLPDLPPGRTSLARGEIAGMMAPEDLTEREQVSRRAAEAPGQRSLGEYGRANASEGPAVVVSHRATELGISDRLAASGFRVELADLECADVVLSDRVAVTALSVQGFIDGMSDGWLLSRLGKMKHQYLHPILVVQGPAEGRGDQAGNAAVYDALGALLSDFKMPVLSTSDADETVAALSALHRQESARSGGKVRGVQTTIDASNRQLFLVQGLPNVSATLAQRLLERFGSVKGIADASPDELMRVDGVGRVIAEGIHTTMRKKFGEEGSSGDG